MVVGNGMVAKRFLSYANADQYLIFASGVSNSKTNDDEAYRRETELLEQMISKHPEKTLVYFSTCSIYDPGESASAYIIHKLKMEEVIQNRCATYQIFRVSNLVGNSDNPNTILNFFIYHIRHKINFDLWTNASRNLLDIDDLFKIADTILQERLFPNQVVNVASPFNYPVTEIIKELEQWYGHKASYVSIPKGHKFTIDISLIEPLIERMGIKFRHDYLRYLLTKYYKT